MHRFIPIALISLLLPWFAPSANAQATGATLFLSPGSGTYNVNKNFTVKVMVDSGGGIGINAAEGAIKFDPAYLTVSKLTDTASIFKLWTTNPTFSNSAGTINFGGGSPGAYKGTAGEIFAITFTAKKAGETAVTWSGGSVLAADGKGTNVFKGFGNGKYTISSAVEAKPETKPTTETEGTKGALPPLPEIDSKTHPKDDVWYQDNDPEFGWKVLADLTGVSFSLTNDAAGDPGSVSDGIVETTKYDNQADGVWYFNIKYQNRYGWGQIGRKKLMIDATPPKPFTVVLDNGGDPTNPAPKLRFSTTDAASGVDFYDIKIGPETKKASAADMEKGYFELGPLVPGEYQALVRAVDKAQNAASSSLRFSVEALKAPIISSIPAVIDRNTELLVSGSSFYPRITARLFIAKPNEEPITIDVATDDQGNWIVIHKERLDKGNYEVWARVIDARGAQSMDSAKHLLTVVSPSIIQTYGLWIIILLLVIIVGLIMYILYLKKEHREEKERIMTETAEVKDKLGKIFAALREEVDELMVLADKRPGLSESERRVKEKLQESLDISEEFIGKEVDDVEKEIDLKKKAE